jgi:hypothetical protein
MDPDQLPGASVLAQQPTAFQASAKEPAWSPAPPDTQSSDQNSTYMTGYLSLPIESSPSSAALLHSQLLYMFPGDADADADELPRPASAHGASALLGSVRLGAAARKSEHAACHSDQSVGSDYHSTGSGAEAQCEEAALAGNLGHEEEGHQEQQQPSTQLAHACPAGGIAHHSTGRLPAAGAMLSAWRLVQPQAAR